MRPDEMLDSFFKTVGGWVEKNAAKYQYVAIPKEQTDAQLDDTPLEPEEHYFRLTLAEMFLTKSREWFTNQYPAVHSTVFLKFADRKRAPFSNVARPPEEKLMEGVFLNYPLTDLLPYNGGTIEIEMSLVALKGTNSLAVAIDVLQDFAGLVAAPLGQVLDVAEKVTVGLERLRMSTKGDIHLGMHQNYSDFGANRLRPGYYAVVMSDDSQLKSKLFVESDRLKKKEGSKYNAYKDADYVLYKVEGTDSRPDIRLGYIDVPFREAQRAYMLGETDKAKTYQNSALLAALEAPDLTGQDRWRVIERLQSDLKRVAGLGKGAAGEPERKLEEVMKEPAPAGTLGIHKGAPTFEEVFGQ
jgi:hypothetical protein